MLLFLLFCNILKSYSWILNNAVHIRLCKYICSLQYSVICQFLHTVLRYYQSAEVACCLAFGVSVYISCELKPSI